MNALAVVFPGQASQRVGMLTLLASRYALVKETFAEVSETLGYDVWKLVKYGPATELNKTYRAQPAILTASVAIWRIWKKQGGSLPKIMAGHSLGEYSALVCAESIDLSVAAKLVMTRGMLMQETVPYGCGAMSVIVGLNRNIISELCKIAMQGQIVAPACFNSSQNIVISGHKEAVDRTNYLCKRAGAKYIFVLPISIPSHCLLMKPMAKQFRKELDKIEICTPSIPIVSNTDVSVMREPSVIRDVLTRQLYTPVRWSEIIQYFLIHQKVFKLVEMGPGKTLATLMPRSVFRGVNIYSTSVNDPDSLLREIQINNN